MTADLCAIRVSSIVPTGLETSLRDLKPSISCWATINRPFGAQAKIRTLFKNMINEIDPDTATLDGLITAFYETISFPPGSSPDWNREHKLFSPTARMVDHLSDLVSRRRRASDPPPLPPLS